MASDVLPPGRFHLLKVSYYSEMAAPTGDQERRHMNFWVHFSFKPPRLVSKMWKRLSKFNSMKMEQLENGEKSRAIISPKISLSTSQQGQAPGMQMKAILRNLCTSANMAEIKNMQTTLSAGEDTTSGEPIYCWWRCQWWCHCGK